MSEEINVKIIGEYRDILHRGSEVIKDSGWKSNVIVEACGRFLAALMRKDFHEQATGIEYIAVSDGSGGSPVDFRNRLIEYFGWLNTAGNTGPSNGVWAKKIEDIKYLDNEDSEVTDITNKLKISVTIEENEPSEQTFNLKEFSLVSICKNPVTNQFDTERMFLVNYVDHAKIEKDKTMELTRTIKLTFPVE